MEDLRIGVNGMLVVHAEVTLLNLAAVDSQISFFEPPFPLKFILLFLRKDCWLVLAAMRVVVTAIYPPHPQSLHDLSLLDFHYQLSAQPHR